MKRFLLLFPLALLLVSAFCKREPPPRARNLVLISVDTLRADRVGSYGAAGDPTPNLDRLAARGVRFEKAFSAVPITTPSHATIFTGTYPHHHGVRSNGTYVLPEERTTLAEVLAEKGVQTAGFVGAFPLDHQFGLDQGFEIWDDEIERAAQSMSPFDAERRAETVMDRALDWFASRDREAPFCLFVHLYDPHHPYTPPEPFRSQFADDPYQGEVAYTDEQIGRLLDALEADGAMDDTLVVMLSDHGESLGEHDESTHMLFVYDATLEVPLIMAGAGLPQGTTVRSPVRLLDVVPTISALLGAETPPDAQGQNLVDLAEGRAQALPDDALFYAESMLPQVQFSWAPLESIRDGQWKFVQAPRQELYDLASDPGETNNLFGQDQERDNRMLRLLRKAELTLKSDDADKAVGQLDQETADKLMSLGYLAGTSGGGSSEDPLSLPDPKDRIEVFNATEDALARAAHGRGEEAIEIFQGIRRQYPDETWIGMTLSRTLMSFSRYDEVLEILTRESVEQLPEEIHGSALTVRAGALEGQGSWEEALEVWNQLGELFPESSDKVHKGRGQALLELGRWDEAVASLEQADSEDAQTQLLMAMASLASGRDAPGRAALQRSRDIDPDAAPDLTVARFLIARGDKGLAAEILRQYADGDPSGRAAYLLSTIETRPDDEVSLRLEASRNAARKGDFSAAAAELEAAIAAGGDSAEVHYDLAVCYINLNRLREAHNELVRSLERDPDFPPAIADYGWLAESRGDADKAEKYYARALAVAPSFPPALTRLGILYSRQGRFDQAVALLQRAVKAQPESPDAHFNLSVALSKAGRVEESRREFDESRRLETARQNAG